MKIGVVGGGMMGLSLAFKLGRLGHDVSVLERENQLGGLVTHHDFGPFVWDRFYHVILPTDRALIGFLKEIKLARDLQWATTLTGFFGDRSLYSLSNSMEFLRFPPLGLWSKFRLAFTILYCSRIDNWRRLERIPVEDFLVRLSGRPTYEKMWRPLLLAKLGENYKRVSAVFIWTYIKRLFSARESSAQKEAMGYVAGGYKAVFDRLKALIEDQGGVVQTGVTVEAASPGSEGGVRLVIDGRAEHFDKVVFTSPVNVLQRVADPSLVSVEESGARVEYLGVVCVVLVTTVPVSPYYVLNIADPEVPFTGVIGMSNVVSQDETAGLYLTYLPKYVHSEDPFLRSEDRQIEDMFMRGLKRVFPEFDDASVAGIHVNRAIKVQPIQVLDYSDIIPRVKTRHPDFYTLNTAQFVNNTLNNNTVIEAVNRFMTDFGAEFSESTYPEDRVLTDTQRVGE